jgi:serine/threonine protein kinase
VIKQLGFGSQGTVVRALYKPTKTVVAIKQFKEIFANRASAIRLFREIQLL